MKNYDWKISMALQFYFIFGMLMIHFVYFHSELGTWFLNIFWLHTVQGWPQHQVYHGNDNNDPNSSLIRVYRKKTFTRLLINYFSVSSYSHKVALRPIRLTTNIKGNKSLLPWTQNNCPLCSLPTTSPTFYPLHRPFSCYHSENDSPFH